MPYFGKTSKSKLITCDESIQTVLNAAIKIVDFSVIYGTRSPEKQFELYKKGRIQKDGEWRIWKLKEIVTYMDGYKKKSKHNNDPSKAVDVIPYPMPGWDTDEFHEQMHYIAGVIMALAYQFRKSGKIKKELQWGGFWKTLVDEPHFQI